MSTTESFVRCADIGWEKMAEGVRRQVLGHGSDLMMVRVEFEKGGIGAMHHHPHRQATYVVAGRFEVKVGDQVTELGTGDVFYAERDVMHGVTALEGGVLLDVFTPIREDFLAPKR
ncbi:MAG: cupin domain-containing protein [Gemmatimonadaceae bacterium]